MSLIIFFAGYQFDDEIPHPHGNILLADLGEQLDIGQVIRWGVPAGRSYPLGSSGKATYWRIERGNGLLRIGKECHEYGPENAFAISPKVPYALVVIHADTVVFQSKHPEPGKTYAGQ